MLKQVPNLLTTLRILLAAPVAWLIIEGEFSLVLVLAFIAGVTDGLDGWIARRFNAQSRYGAIADPISDKALLIGTFVSLAWVGLVPEWVAWLVVARDVVILTGAICYHWLYGRYDMAPSFWGKASTLVQICFALMVLTQQVTPVFTAEVFQGMLWLLIALAIISGGNYIKVWGGKAMTHASANTPDN
ncbi:CDP-alcohol phosphatidyltransferase family protein [Aurantivibrio plasticivorans]